MNTNIFMPKPCSKAVVKLQLWIREGVAAENKRVMNECIHLCVINTGLFICCVSYSKLVNAWEQSTRISQEESCCVYVRRAHNHELFVFFFILWEFLCWKTLAVSGINITLLSLTPGSHVLILFTPTDVIRSGGLSDRCLFNHPNMQWDF